MSRPVIAGEILFDVDRREIRIDGVALPWAISADNPPSVDVGTVGMPSQVTITLFADDVQILRPLETDLREQREAADRIRLELSDAMHRRSERERSDRIWRNLHNPLISRWQRQQRMQSVAAQLDAM